MYDTVHIYMYTFKYIGSIGWLGRARASHSLDWEFGKTNDLTINTWRFLGPIRVAEGVEHTPPFLGGWVI